MTISPRSPRILLLDFWRGICLLMIFVNHIPENPLSILSLRSWGFSDAAEVFVFLAGFSATLAFSRYFHDGGLLCGVLRVVKRTWQLFCAHVLLVFALSIVIAIAGDFVDSKPIMEQMNFSPFFVETDVAILRLVKLKYMPSTADMLPIYIVFISMFPVMWLLMRISPYVALIASFLLWLWANVTGYSFSNYPEGSTWFFNPLAWQFMFVSGGVAAMLRDKTPAVIKSNILLAFCIVVVLVGVVAAAPWTYYEPSAVYRIIPADFLSLDNKRNLSILRIVHFLAILILAVRLLPPSARFWNSRVVPFVATAGRHALPVYCTGTALSLAGHIFLSMHSAGTIEFLLVDVVGITILIGLGFALEYAHSTLSAVRLSSPAPACVSRLLLPERTTG
jgi:hypothetical protein